MAAYTYGQLEDLWRQAGGPSSVAPVMAAIGLAESGGRNVKQKGQPPATTGWGIWQITPGNPSLLDPRRNAEAAVAKYHSQGLRAWSTYTTGRYKAFLMPGQHGFGIFSQGNFAGVDQGVDFRGAGVIPALDSITITSVRKVSIIEGGSWPLVGFRFDSGPYKGRFGYVMENFTPKVKPGQRLKPGQPIGIAAGSFPYVETGFAANASGTPLAPLGSNPHAPTGPGQAMLSYIQSKSGSQIAPVVVNGHTITSDQQLQNLIKSGLASSDPIQGPVQGAVGSAESVAHFLGRLTDPTFWLRALEIVGGMTLVLMGLYMLARQMGVAPSPEQVAGATPVGRAAKWSDEAAAEMQFSPGRKAYSGPRRRRSSVDVSEAGERRTRRRELAARGSSRSDEIPF